MAQPKSKTISICLGLALAVLGVFSPALKCDFTNYDDPSYITDNPHIQQGITAESLKWAFTSGHASIWHPLTWISHMLDVQIYGLNPTGHHLTNVLIHAASTALMFLVVRRMTGALWASAFIAAMFGLHPLRVESVVWACQRKDVLSTLFWILTASAYVHYVQTSARRQKWLALALLFFAFALMSKPMVVTLPFVLLLIDFWPLKRINASRVSFATLKPLLFEKLPFFALAVIASIVTVFVERAAMPSLGALTFSERVENAFIAYMRYVGKTLWPSNLELPYLTPGHWPWWQIVASITLVALITVIAFRHLRTRPFLAVGWFWFLGTLVPVIGVLQSGYQAMADRFSYVPSVGLFILITWSAVEFLRNRTALALAAAIAIAACCVLTNLQIGYWKNSRTLFRHAIEVDPRNYVAYTMLGLDLADSGQPEQAIPLYKKAIEIDPTYADAYNNLGSALVNTGDLDAAIHEYQTALNIDPNDPVAHNNYGIALAMKGQSDEAIAQFRLAVPHHASSHGNLGNAYAAQANDLLAHGNTAAAQQKFDDAVAEFTQILTAYDPQAHYNLGSVLAQRGKLDEAIQQFRTAIQIKPENPEAHFALGFVLANQGKTTEAESEYLLALKQKPNYPEATERLQALHSPK
ncbi:MAG: tetratricopeptide repeat protein [Limisphaerales bacterium]